LDEDVEEEPTPFPSPSPNLAPPPPRQVATKSCRRRRLPTSPQPDPSCTSESASVHPPPLPSSKDHAGGVLLSGRRCPRRLQKRPQEKEHCGVFGIIRSRRYPEVPVIENPPQVPVIGIPPQVPVMENPAFYGEPVRQMHNNLRGCGLLIRVGNKSQSGVVIACGVKYCYVLTVVNSLLRNAENDIFVTFVDGREIAVKAFKYGAHCSNNLSIIFLKHGTEEVPGMQQVQFSGPEDIKDTVVYTLRNCIRKVYRYEGRNGQAAATSIFTGGNAGVLSHKNNGADDFWHNCSAGYGVTRGSGVFNRMSQTIGMNLLNSEGWTNALRLDRIKDEIKDMFPETAAMMSSYICRRSVGSGSSTSAAGGPRRRAPLGPRLLQWSHQEQQAYHNGLVGVSQRRQTWRRMSDWSATRIDEGTAATAETTNKYNRIKIT
ncbi:hypothetical protein EJB05_32144, partial [Eragrostis curvula]